MEKSNPSPMMQLAIDLGSRGFPAPNPHVGCVIVRDGEVVGRGWHDHAGGAHAEVVALAEAGSRAQGADVFVTLEPCNHTGRTGPCSQALIRAGVRSVTFSGGDPNPKATGGGDALRSAGISVQVGDGYHQARDMNRVWLYAQETGLVYVCVKVATTRDGYLARPDGSSKWITGERARAAGQRLRAEMGSVLVGIGTVIADDPMLTARIDGVVNQPVKVILDPRGRATGHERLWETGRTIHVVSAGAIHHGERLELKLRESSTFDLRELCAELRRLGLIGVLVEGGAKTIQQFFHDDLVQEFNHFIAPIEWGDGVPWVQNGDNIVSNLNLWQWDDPVDIEPDVLQKAYRANMIGTDRSS